MVAIAVFTDPRIGAVTIPWKNVADHLIRSDKVPDDENIYH